MSVTAEIRRAERALARLEDYRANLRANCGVPYPATLDGRIEWRRAQLAALMQREGRERK